MSTPASPYPKTFCPLPWVHQATLTDGSILLCCVAMNDPEKGLNLNRTTFSKAFHSPYWNEVRRKMLNGDKPEHCKRCWVEEKNGYRSHRVTEIDVWERRMGREKILDLIQNTQADGAVDFSPVSLDLRIGNTCNLQCVMCRPHDSIKWLALSEKMHGDAVSKSLKEDMQYKKSLNLADFEWQESDDVWDQLLEMAPTLNEVIVGGGEPMLLKNHFKFLKHCVEHGFAGQIQLRYHTNLTVLDRTMFDLWRHFKLVEFFVSLDGVGEINTYVRYPAKWQTIEENLDFLDSVPHDNVRIMLLFSSHFLSLFYLDQFSEWVEAKRFKKVTHGYNGYFHPGIVMQPSYLSPQVYPQAIKQEIAEKLQAFEKRSKKPSHKVHGVIQYMLEADKSDNLPTVMEYIGLLDRHRGTDFKKTFPELYARIYN